ncbi:hypothetical protein [Saccharothrix syringae]|nr:hypothetical protein [Saccharothrix syringae]
MNVFVAAQIAYSSNSRSLERFRPHVGLRVTPWLPAGSALQLLFT